MTADEVLALINTVLQPKKLTSVQEIILRECWLKQTYAEIAHSQGYAPDYIRITGAQLWQLLSDTFGCRVTKSNLRVVLEKYWQRQSTQPGDRLEVTATLPTRTNPAEFEVPTGQVPLNSTLYVERPPVEAQCYATILQPGALIRIKAPKQMGKTSLMAKTLAHARTAGLQTVALTLQEATGKTVEEVDRFFAWFSTAVSHRLGLPDRRADYWDDTFGISSTCTDYFENAILTEVNRGLVLAIDELDTVFKYPELATDFLDMLRAWYERARYGTANSQLWQRLRLIVVHSTEVYLTLEVNRSPFNVGLSIELPEFTPNQVYELVRRHDLELNQDDVAQLMDKVGGNPLLIRLALHTLTQGSCSLAVFLQTAASADSVYGDDLRRKWFTLRQYPQLADAYGQVVHAATPVKLKPALAFELHSLGLVSWQAQGVVPSYKLYQEYFQACLEP